MDSPTPTAALPTRGMLRREISATIETRGYPSSDWWPEVRAHARARTSAIIGWAEGHFEDGFGQGECRVDRMHQILGNILRD